MKQKVKASPVVMFFAKDIGRLEHDPNSQYRFNRFWAIFWFLQMPMIALLLILFNHLWIEISIFYVTEASLWANFATHFGSMSSSLAAINTTKTVTAIDDNVDDMQQDVSQIADVFETSNA
jgi:hypothetical protein